MLAVPDELGPVRGVAVVLVLVDHFDARRVPRGLMGVLVRMVVVVMVVMRVVMVVVVARVAIRVSLVGLPALMEFRAAQVSGGS